MAFLKWQKAIVPLCAGLLTTACVHHRTIKEVKYIGFDDDLGKGKSIGQISADDCNYHILGYPIGAMPTIANAVRNAQKEKKTNFADTVHSSNEGTRSVKYLNNVTVAPSGFDAVIFGKNCINISGLGYK